MRIFCLIAEREGWSWISGHVDCVRVMRAVSLGLCIIYVCRENCTLLTFHFGKFIFMNGGDLRGNALGSSVFGLLKRLLSAVTDIIRSFVCFHIRGKVFFSNEQSF